MSGGPTKSWVLNWTNAHLHDAEAKIKTKAEQLEQTFQGHLTQADAPGGTQFSGQLKTAVVDQAQDALTIARRIIGVKDQAQTVVNQAAHEGEARQRLAANAISSAEHTGYMVTEDLKVIDTQPCTDSKSSNERALTAKTYEDSIKARAGELWETDQGVETKLTALATEMSTHTFPQNGATPLDTTSKPQDEGNYYKTQYPTKTTPASTDVAAADPNAPKLGPAVPADKPAVDPKSVGSLGSVTGILDANRKPDAKPADQPAPQSKGFIDGWIDAAKQKGEGLLNHVEDLTGLHGSEKFKDAWIDTGIGVGKDMLRESLGIKDPTPLEQTLDAYSKAQFNKEHGLSAAQVAGQEMFDFQSKNAALAAEAASLGPGKLIEKGIVEGAVAADARAALSGAAAPTVDSALTNSIKGFFENATTPHVEAPATPHLETPSLPRAEVPAVPHVEAPATPHVETPPLPGADVPAAPHVEAPTPHADVPASPRAEVPAASHLETPAGPRAEIPAAPHVEAPTTPRAESVSSPAPSVPAVPHAEAPAPAPHQPWSTAHGDHLGGDHSGGGPGGTPSVDHAAPTGEHPVSGGDHHAPADHSPPADLELNNEGGTHRSAGDHAPVAGRDYGLAPNDIFKILDNPTDEIARLEQGGVPRHLTDGYDPLAGRTVDQFEREFTVPGRDGSPRWDWAGQAPNNGFDGPPTISDRIPGGHLLDRLGSEQGAYMADNGAPLGTRGMPPGVASDYSQYVSTGQPVPPGVPWEVRSGPAKEAFGQPGGAPQWVVVDKTTGEEIPVEIVKDSGMISDYKGTR